MAGTSCWQYMKCGRETDCPAYPDHGFDCWAVEGTLCRGERQAAYDVKVGECRKMCPYYDGVMLGTIKAV